ncbi:hypothetical protein V8J88_23705 [Massilia sp. W12]|uniref:type IV pilus assembly protein FimV n=1 Tax=Massilia sp. W12 TaxID=3126507 RepID=UPI0030D2804F
MAGKEDAGGKRARRNIVAALLAACSWPAQALGLGEAQLHSHFGQPLAAQVSLLGNDLENLHPSCIRANLLNLEGVLLQQAQVRLQTERQRLVISSANPLHEPAFTLQVQMSCGQIVSRNWDLLLDLPAQASTPQAIPSATPHTRSKRKPAHAEVHSEPAAPGAPAATAAAASAHMRQSSARKIPPPPADAPRPVLRLSAAQDSAMHAEIEELVLAKAFGLSPESLQKLQRATSPAAKTETSTAPLELTALQQKIRMLEAEAERLQRLSAQQERQLSGPANASGAPWLAGLGALLSLAMLAIGWLLWRVRGLRQQAGLWRSLADQSTWQNSMAPATAPPATPAPRGRAGKPASTPAPASSAPAPQTAAPASTPAPPQPSHTPEPEAALAFVGNLRQPPAPAQHEEDDAPPVRQQDLPQVGEVTDILHEAEFWVSLGQNDKAAALLEHTIAPEPAAVAPLVWMYLLDLYRALGREPDFQRCRRQFMQYCNVHIPEWNAAPPAGPGLLAQRPELCQRISLLWGTSQAIPFLQDMLRDDRAGERHGFDLDEYRELMFLLDLARTRAQMDEDELHIEFNL